MYLYTDGSCLGNPGVGGWAYAFVSQENELIAIGKGATCNTTNNRMELQATIQGLSAVPEGLRPHTLEASKARGVILCTDSQYLIKGATEWRYGWEQQDFEGVKNLDLWAKLFLLVDARRVRWRHVKAHSGCEWNEYVDNLARHEAKKLQKYLNK